MRAKVTLEQAKRKYDRLRLKYFMDAESPLKVPPLASELRWYWLSEKGHNHGETNFDEDSDPESIGLDPSMSRCFMTVTLLHELTHMRNPSLNCGGTGKPPAGWWEEQMRLSALGAPLL